ncbi:MAG: cellulase family glycosylhydrolase, partial [Flavobacteriaceae bacterium]|nr:cellulase family glycosylhydrolase [Flavobacteriaceae bacterium]
MNKKVLTFLGCICFLTSVAQISPDDMIIQMGRGLNIGNVLSAPTEGAWSPAIEQQYFIDVATAGFTNVRIPIDFYGVHTTGDTTGYATNNGTSGSYTGSSADYVVDPAYLNRLEEIIGWGLDEGLVIT